MKMAEYIEREATKKEFNIHFGDVHDAVIANRLIDSIQAADVAPIRHGFWVSNIGGTHFCSECGRDALHYQFDKLCFREELSDFCPRCGAFLDLEE